MHIEIGKNSHGRYELFITSSGKTLFQSTDELFPFVGNYSDYSNVKSAVSAYNRLVYLNKDLLIAQEDSVLMAKKAFIEVEETEDSIKSGFVEKYNKRIQFFLDMIDRIEQTKNKGDIRKRVANLKQMVDQFSTLVDKTAIEFENDDRPIPISDEQGNKEIAEEKFLSPYAKEIMRIKKKISVFHKRLKRNFGEYLEAYSKEFCKLASIAEDEWKIAIISDFTDGILDTIDLNGSFIRKIEKSGDCFESEIDSKDGGLIIGFNEDLLFNKLVPTGKLLISHPMTTQSYYNSLWKPSVKSVGHFLFEDNYVVVPEYPEGVDEKIGQSESGEYIKDVFSGFDVRDNSSVIVKIVMKKKSMSSTNTYNFRVAARKGKEQEIIDRMQIAEQMIRSSNMVKCFGTGTKYDGVAGTIDKSRVKKCDGHYEVPVNFKFDNGMKEEIILSSDNLEKFL